MKQVDNIFYENKHQTENLTHRYFYITSISANDSGTVLKGQYVRGIPFNDESDGTHYMIPGVISIKILCKNASLLSPKERISSEKKLVAFKEGFFSKKFTLCFEDLKGKYYELKCKDFYIIYTKGYYDINNEYISVEKYREDEALKHKRNLIKKNAKDN